MPSNRLVVLKAFLAFALSLVTLLFLYIGVRTTWDSFAYGDIRLSGIIVGTSSSVLAFLVFLFIVADALKNIKRK